MPQAADSRTQISQALKDESKISVVATMHPSEVALGVQDFPAPQIYRLFQKLSNEFVGRILVDAHEEFCEEILKLAQSDEIVAWFSDLASDEHAYLLSLLPKKRRDAVLQTTDQAAREEAHEILRYSEDQIGSVMQTEMLVLHLGDNVNQSIQKVRKTVQAETIDNFTKAYVVNEEGLLKGAVSLTALLISTGDTPIEALIEEIPLVVQPEMESEHVANLALHYNEVSLPVVMEDGRLVGRLTLDDLGEVLQDEMDEDIAMMAGTGEEDYASRKILRTIHERLPWLLLSLTGGMGAAYLLVLFDKKLQGHPHLIFFVPLIAGMGGSVAVQSSTIVVRGMARGEIFIHDLFKRCIKELQVALLNGSACGLALFLLCTILNFGGHGFAMGMFVAMSLLIIMVIAGISGTAIPLLLKKASIEPAYSTGPFITIGNDIVGIAIYLFLVSEVSGYFLNL